MGDNQALKALQLKARQLNRDVKAANWNGHISPETITSDRVGNGHAHENCQVFPQSHPQAFFSGPRQGLGDEGFKKNWRQRRSKPSIHRVSRGLHASTPPFSTLTLVKPAPDISLLTDSARFAKLIEDDFLCLRQRRRSGLQAGEGYGPSRFSIRHLASSS